MRLLPLMLGLCLCACTLTAQADGETDRRALQQQRTALDAVLARDIERCQTRFAVNACLDNVRASHSAAISPLTARLDALDADQRLARAAAQKERVAERQREFAAEEGRRRTQALKPPDASNGLSALSAAQPGEVAGSSPTRASRAVDPDLRAKQLRKQAVVEAKTAQNNRDQLAERQRQQQVRLQDQQQRAEARARSGKKPGAPLPLPTPAEVAAAVASAASAPRP